MLSNKQNWVGDVMSRDALRNFLQAVEHDRLMRVEAAGCRTEQELLNLAQRNGFSIHLNDLLEDDEASRIGSWFKSSRINFRRF